MSFTNANEPLKPEWPVNVMVFKPTDNVDDIKKRIKPTEDPIQKYEKDGVMKDTHNTKHHFDTKHYALLFHPGEYKDCRFEVGYYVQMAGLGKDAEGPNAVRFTGERSGPYVEALNKHREGSTNQILGTGLCLDSFWRSAENFSSENTQWAVSQAAPLRRASVANQLMFGDGGAYSSGGFVANTKAGGICSYAANQQWFSRACDFKHTEGGAWSTVFSGCTGGGIPEDNSVKGANVRTVEKTPEVRLEKPYIAVDADGSYELHVPKVTREATTGVNLDSTNNEIRSFSNVKVGKPILPMKGNDYVNHDMETYNILSEEDEKINDELQQALDEGKDLVLCPGIFFLKRSLVVKHPNQVILGLGLATLIAPQDGSPCISVKAKTPGVRVAGLMLEASVQSETKGRASDGKSALLSFGELDITDDAGDANNPGLISDIFTRVGGSNFDRTVNSDIMVRVHSGHVVGDNLWLWRADHVKLRPGEKGNDASLPLYWQTRMWKEENGKKALIDGTGECVTKNGIEVTGNDVKMYGLFCEHTTEHQCVWKGERGSTTFFQCELPYDVDADFSVGNFTGYYVDESVNEHTARGIGVYSNFTVYNVKAPTAIRLPSKKGIVLQNPFTIFLDNGGSIEKVVDQGGALVGNAVNSESKGPQRAWIGEKRVEIISVPKKGASSSFTDSLTDSVGKS